MRSVITARPPTVAEMQRLRQPEILLGEPGAITTAALEAAHAAIYAIRNRVLRDAGPPAIRVNWPDDLPEDQRLALEEQLRIELARLWLHFAFAMTGAMIDAGAAACTSAAIAVTESVGAARGRSQH